MSSQEKRPREEVPAAAAAAAAEVSTAEGEATTAQAETTIGGESVGVEQPATKKSKGETAAGAKDKADVPMDEEAQLESDSDEEELHTMLLCQSICRDHWKWHSCDCGGRFALSEEVLELLDKVDASRYEDTLRMRRDPDLLSAVRKVGLKAAGTSCIELRWVRVPAKYAKHYNLSSTEEYREQVEIDFLGYMREVMNAPAEDDAAKLKQHATIRQLLEDIKAGREETTY